MYSLLSQRHMCVDIVVNVELVTGGVLDDNGSSHCVDEVTSIAYTKGFD